MYVPPAFYFRILKMYQNFRSIGPRYMESKKRINPVIMAIHNSTMDIHNWIVYIHNSIMDSHN